MNSIKRLIVELVEDSFGFGPRADRAITALEETNEAMRLELAEMKKQVGTSDYMRSLYADAYHDLAKADRTWNVLFAPTEGGGE